MEREGPGAPSPSPNRGALQGARDVVASPNRGALRGAREVVARGAPQDMFQEGAILEAKDHMGERWWEAKVLEVDTEGSEVLVHFAGWNGRHDEWIKMDSPRLQPYTRRSSRRRQSTGDSSGAENPLSPRTGILPSTASYTYGEEVMALWQNGRKYPAVVQRQEPDGAVSVQFYDGFVKSVRSINVRRMLAADTDFVKDCKEQQLLAKTSTVPAAVDSSSDAMGTEGDSPAPPGPSKTKRERKTKFNVREVLNLKETSPKVAKASPSSAKASSSSKQSKSDPAPSLLDGVNSEPYERSDKVFEAATVTAPVEEVGGEDIEVVDLSESFDVKSEAGCGVSETGSEGHGSEGTPSEKENINSDNGVREHGGQGRALANGGTNGVSEMRVKRARKRKRFADEELAEGGNSTKHLKVGGAVAPLPSRPLSSAPRTPTKTSKAKTPSGADLGVKVLTKRTNPDSPRKRSRPDKSEHNRTSLVKSSQNNNSSTDTTPLPSARFSYLTFDFSLPPDQLLAVLQEGVNVPGLLTPLTMASPKLPSGWSKRVSLRPSLSGPATKWDVTIESPEGRTFRSRQELSRHFEEAAIEHSIETFDFGLDTQLKRIRQIWKASQVPVTPDCKPTPPAPLVPLPEISPPVDRVSPPPSPAPPAPSTPLPSSAATPEPPKAATPKPKPLRLPPTDSERAKLEITMRVGSLTPSTPVIGTLSETGQGVRCPLEKCNKLFRNEKLLLQHVKHYHPDYTGLASPSGGGELGAHRSKAREEGGGGNVERKVDVREKVVEAKVEKVKEKVANETVKELVKESVKESVMEPAKEVGKELVEDVVKQVVVAPPATPPPPPPSSPPQPPPKRLSVDVRKLDMASRVGEVALPTPLPSPTTPRPESTPRPRPKRLRTDSLLSVGTEGAIASSPPPSPAPLQPSYKHSRRRAQQLRSQPATPGGSPPGELEDTVQTMEEDEVVNCVCGHPDGDGMMVQCEVCLTWQHGACIGVDSEEQVPQHYICSICRQPPLGRASALYCIDHEWIREGKLPGLPPSPPPDATLKQLSSLMADLCSLSEVLHSLQVKLSVAAQKNNPKVFMWSSPWDPSCSLPPAPDLPNHQEPVSPPDLFPPDMESLLGGVEEERREDADTTSDNLKTRQSEEHGELPATTSSPQPSGSPPPEEPPSHNPEEINKVRNIQSSSSSVPAAAANPEESSSQPVESPKKPPPEDSGKMSPSSMTPEDDGMRKGDISSELATLFSSEGFLPSVSELQLLLPGVIQDISQGQQYPQQAVRGSNPTLIPEPKRLDREECRLNLLHHVEQIQDVVGCRLQEIETRLDALESSAPPSTSAPAPLAPLLQDLRAAQRLNSALPDRL